MMMMMTTMVTKMTMVMKMNFHSGLMSAEPRLLLILIFLVVHGKYDCNHEEKNNYVIGEIMPYPKGAQGGAYLLTKAISP